MGTQTISSLGLAKAGVNKVLRVESETVRQAWSEIGPPVDTKEEYYRVKVITGFGNASVVNEGAPVPSDSKVSLYTPDFYPLKWAKAYEPTVEAESADFYGEVMNYAPSMAKAMRRAMNKDMANKLNNGFDSAYAIYDAQALFSTAHPGITGVTGSNRPTTGSSLGSLSLETGIQGIMAQTDPNGEPMEFESSLNLFVPTQMLGLANRIVTASGLAGTNDNDPNWGGGKIAKVSHQQYLSSNTAWFLLMSNPDEHGIRMLRRTKYKTKIGDEIRTLKTLVVAYAEWLAMVMLWQGSYGDPGA